MRSGALIVALYLTSTLAACAQPGPDGPPPGYAGQPGYGQDGGPPPGYAQQGGAPQGGPQQGWAGGMQSANGQGQPTGPAPMAQGPGPQGPGPGPAPAPVEGHGGLAAKFRRANTTGDGRLTQQQARAGRMGGVAKHFAEIDRDQKGYVTLQDVRAWHQEKHAEKKQGGGQPAAAPGGGYPPPAQSGQQY
jgi:hypothetical protein